MICRTTFRAMATSKNIANILKFDNKALVKLPLDSIKENYVRQVKDACFSLVTPTSLKDPKLVVYSEDALKLLGLPSDVLKSNIEELAPFLCGNKLFNGSQSAAHCYCGHQFGNFAGQLGDGAAMYLGEAINKDNERWEFQIKGCGQTPYSRSADGRKVLRSSLREFLCSEAMHYLGIPTTRAGSIITSDSWIVRDILYDGHPKMERCSVVLRIASTFIRFGSFEICKPMDPKTQRQGPSLGNNNILKVLLEYVIEEFYPEIWNLHVTTELKTSCYLEFFREIVKRTAILVAKWQCVGFCHGVLNTDNMSIVGVTIDYGPFGFMDRYDPGHICNSSDTAGRYSFKKQPEICKWNCLKLAEALHDLIPLQQSKEIVENTFDSIFNEEYNRKMASKLGLTNVNEDINNLVSSLLTTMYDTGADYTNTFLALEKIVAHYIETGNVIVDPLLTQNATVEEMKKAYKPMLEKRDRQFFWAMAGNDRETLLRMGGQFVLDEEEKEKKLEKYQELTENDKLSNDKELWLKWLDQYKLVLQKQLSSASSEDKDGKQSVLKRMQQNNPRIVLRNYVAQLAISAAEQDDYSVSHKLLQLLADPYSNSVNNSDSSDWNLPPEYKKDSNDVCVVGNMAKPPTWASELVVS